MKDERLYLVDRLKTARRIQVRVDGLSRQRFDDDENLQLALTHLIQIVGEAARHVSPDARSQFPSVSWNAITGMRHRLVHDYGYVNLEIVWAVATVKIPELMIHLAPVVDPLIEMEQGPSQDKS